MVSRCLLVEPSASFSLVVAGTVVIGLMHAFFLLLAGLTGTG